MPKISSPWEYVKAVLKRSLASWGDGEIWLALAAYLAILLVPLLATGLVERFLGDLVNTTLAALAYGWLLLLLLVISPFRIWKDERNRAIELSAQLRPSLLLTFDGSSGCQHVTSVQGRSGQIKDWKKLFLRTKAEAVGQSISDCQAYLVDVQKRDQGSNQFISLPSAQPIKLVWAVSHEEKADVPTGVVKYVDVVEINQRDLTAKIAPCPALPLDMADIFKEHGIYRLLISVSGGSQSANCAFIFEWDGDWQGIANRQKAWPS